MRSAPFHEAASLLSQSDAKQGSILCQAATSFLFGSFLDAMQSFPRGICGSRPELKARHDATRLYLAHFLRGARWMYGVDGAGAPPDRMGRPRPEPEPARCDKTSPDESYTRRA